MPWLIAMLVFMAPAPAAAEPVTMMISALAASSITIGGTSFALSSVISAAFTVASIGMSVYQYMAQQAAMKRARAAAQAALDQQGARFIARGTVQPWQTVYGRTFKSGNVFFEQVKPPFYYIGIVLASHEIDGVEAVYLNGKKLAIDPTGFVVSDPFYLPSSAVGAGSSGVPWAMGNSRAQVSIRLGTDDQNADPILLADFPSLGANFRQRGHATLVVKCHYGASYDEFSKVWDGSAPTPAAVFRGKKVFDPRRSEQSADDKATWAWRQHPSLCTADFLRYEYGGRLSDATYDWARLAESARVDETAVVTRDGITEAQYTLDGIVDTTASAVDVLRSFLLCCRGRLISTESGLAVISGSWRAPVFTIHDGILAGGIDYQADAMRKEVVNVVRTRIVDPGSQYQLVDGPTYRSEDMIAADGQEYATTLGLQFVTGGPRAQRLTKAYVVDSRLGRALRLRLDLIAMCLEPGDVVTVELEIAPICNGFYMVERVSFVDSFTAVEIEVVETSPEIGYFDPSVDEAYWTAARSSSE